MTAIGWSRVIAPEIWLSGSFLIARPAGNNTDRSFVGLPDQAGANRKYPVTIDHFEHPTLAAVGVEERRKLKYRATSRKERRRLDSRCHATLKVS
jgi:hypothetical protein